uniref:Ig-like domain-containing protein n=1 Tax=Neolamprologus brichardi TaxID=32507 RepID=A0A3Q4I2S3_NEOBR
MHRFNLCFCFCVSSVSQHALTVVVEVNEDFIILPCKTKPELPEGSTVQWTRSDRVVHVYSNRSDHLKNQDDLYCGRTKMNKDLLRTGDLSLTLKYPTERDSGGYICTIYRDKDILRHKVVLQVKGQRCKYRSEVSVVDLGQNNNILLGYLPYLISTSP